MKNIWKVLSALCAMALLLTIPVFAGGDNANLPDDYEIPPVAESKNENTFLTKESEIQPRGPQCSACGSNMTKTDSSSSAWSTYDYAYCTCEGGGKPMDDALQERYVTTTYTCTNTKCGYSETSTQRFTRRVHYG